MTPPFAAILLVTLTTATAASLTYTVMGDTLQPHTCHDATDPAFGTGHRQACDGPRCPRGTTCTWVPHDTPTTNPPTPTTTTSTPTHHTGCQDHTPLPDGTTGPRCTIDT